LLHAADDDDDDDDSSGTCYKLLIFDYLGSATDSYMLWLTQVLTCLDIGLIMSSFGQM